MRSLFVLIFSLSMIACGDGDRRPENQSSNPLYPSGPEQVQRGQIVTGESSAVSGAEVVIIDAERLVVLARAPVDDQGGFEVSVPQRPSYWLGVSGPYMTTYIDTAFAFTGEAITVDEAPRSHPAGKAAQVVGILGDVNNDNQVDIADALLVLLYTLERISFVAPNQGNIALGDVNKDGQVDLADVLLIMTYIANPLDPTLPEGIGLAADQTTGAIAVDQDRAVLIALYEATGGDNWRNDTNWLISPYSLDQWHGVETNGVGRVTSLDLSGNQLTGTIPETLGQLNNLQSLNLTDNELTGLIPETLGQLNNLQSLNLAYNELTGPIPEALGQLDNLESLNLDSNKLTGTIPEALGNLNNLKILDLSSNGLAGTIPEALGQLNNLERLSLAGNELTGPIPEALGQLDNLESLNLDSNKLTGTIPEALGNLNNLKSLSLRGNQLTGCIPSALNSVPNNDFNNLELAFCHLESGEAAILAAFYEATGGDHWKDNTYWLSGAPLSEWYGVTTDDEGWVISLDLSGDVGLLYGDYPSGNGLRGTIPEALGQLDNLEYLSLYRNELTGTIPEALGNLNNLKYLSLDSNKLTGTIPETLGNLNNLKYLDLSSNGLTGTIPEALGQLDNLEYLSLRSNELTGTIPETLGNLNNLKYLYLAWNELTGCIPSALQAVPNNNLDVLGLAFCQ